MKRMTIMLFGILAIPFSAKARTIEGFTQPYETVHLAAPEAGIIQKLHVEQGAKVSVGKPICLLDNAVLRASLEAARAKAASKGSVLAAEAVHRQRTSRLAHMQRLREEGHASPEELERAESDFEISSANLATAREEAQSNALAVKQFEAQLERRTIRSPLDGVVSHVARRPGEFVSATDAEVVTIVQLDRLRVVFQIPTEQIASLKVDDNVQVRFSSSREVAKATVDFISPITDAQSNLVRVEVVIPNEQGKFRSGVRCDLLNFRKPNAPSKQQTRKQQTRKQQTRNQPTGEQHVAGQESRAEDSDSIR